MIPPTCKQTECTRTTAHVGVVYIRIPRFVVGEASIESGSRHRLLFMAAPDPLLAADNFFSLFF